VSILRSVRCRRPCSNDLSRPPSSIEEQGDGPSCHAREPDGIANAAPLASGPVVEWPRLAVLQARYVATEHALERRLIGVEFERAERELEALLAEVVDVSPDADAGFTRATWCRHLRRSGLSYRAIGERTAASAGQLRRLPVWLERELARPADLARADGAALDDESCTEGTDATTNCGAPSRDSCANP
jgi:hypothetical protein